METTTGFTVTDYLPYPFPEVRDACSKVAIDALAHATRHANRELGSESTVLAGDPQGLRAEPGELRVTPWGLLEFPLQWRSLNGSLVIDATLRVLPVDGGQDQPVTELLLHGSFCSDLARALRPVGWVHHIVESFGDLVARAMDDRAPAH